MRRPPDQLSLLDCAVLIAKHAYPQLVGTHLFSSPSHCRGSAKHEPRLWPPGSTFSVYVCAASAEHARGACRSCRPRYCPCPMR